MRKITQKNEHVTDRSNFRRFEYSQDVMDSIMDRLDRLIDDSINQPAMVVTMEPVLSRSRRNRNISEVEIFKVSQKNLFAKSTQEYLALLKARGNKQQGGHGCRRRQCKTRVNG